MARGGKHARSLSRPGALYKPARAGELRATTLRSTHHRSTMPPEPTVAEFRVRYAETDQMGVVYHSNYLIWC